MISRLRSESAAQSIDEGGAVTTGNHAERRTGRDRGGLALAGTRPGTANRTRPFQNRSKSADHAVAVACRGAGNDRLAGLSLKRAMGFEPTTLSLGS